MPELSLRDLLIRSVVLHEGYETKVYFDSLGIPTIGVGFNLQREDARARIKAVGANYDRILAGVEELSSEQIYSLLNYDLERSLVDAKDLFPEFQNLIVARQIVLGDMLFNLGKTRFMSFKKLINAVHNSDWAGAVYSMENSKWHTQVGQRALRLEDMMGSGVVSPAIARFELPQDWREWELAEKDLDVAIEV